MSRHRLYLEQSLTAGAEIDVEGDRAHYLSRVLRVTTGQRVRLFNGADYDYVSTVVAANKHRVRLHVDSRIANATESPLAITLLQGVSRGDRMDFVVQKATELGVQRILPVLSEFSVVKLDRERAARRRQHWEKVACSACEQCGRSRLPTIAPPTDLHAALEATSAATLKLVFSPEGTSLNSLQSDSQHIDVLVGPEGGLSAAELDAALALGYRAVSLGPRILRTETAALAALAALQTRWGDL